MASQAEDDDILQDFLVEAGELLEKLNGQLVELEQRPQDRDLLNAVFRSFHTIKGGGGFLGLTPLVAVCHRAEDVFNVLRQGERQIDAALMDTILQVLDIVNVMFAQLSSGEPLSHAAPELLQRLETYTQATAAASPPITAAPVSPAQIDDADAEFEAMLAARDAPPAVATVATAETAGDAISDAEFEALLDELQGVAKQAAPVVAPAVSAAASPAADAASADAITDAEFEALLDQLHGTAKPAMLPVDQAAAPQTAPARHLANAVPVSTQVAAETTVRVDTKRLDDIMNLVGELVLVRNRLSTLKATMENEAMSKAVANLDLVTSDLQSAVMKTRMQPIKKVFGRFPRVVRDIARTLKKEITLELQGEETDLDKNLVEALADPLVHLVRNAVDHGIEMPDVREKAGKPRSGTVVLAAEQEGDHILLTIQDDGGGMDPMVLRGKAVEKGLMDADSAARLSDKECYDLIFMPGFSTKSEISDVSGRGVGMDVVKTRISQLNGTVDIDSAKGRGTIIIIKVPLTLAIMPTLMVKLQNRTFAVPLSSVSEIFPLDARRTNHIDGQLVVMVRDKPLPMYFLQRWLTPGAENSATGQVVMVHVGSQRVGFVVDQVLGQEEVVIKPLGALLHGLPGFSGATITGDGRIALILDVPSLMKAYARRM
ncbi:MAG: chemotaxis protein CheA [Gammaproteobacteria bacterium]